MSSPQAAAGRQAEELGHLPMALCRPEGRRSICTWACPSPCRASPQATAKQPGCRRQDRRIKTFARRDALETAQPLDGQAQGRLGRSRCPGWHDQPAAFGRLFSPPVDFCQPAWRRADRRGPTSADAGPRPAAGHRRPAHCAGPRRSTPIRPLAAAATWSGDSPAIPARWPRGWRPAGIDASQAWPRPPRAKRVSICRANCRAWRCSGFNSSSRAILGSMAETFWFWIAARSSRSSEAVSSFRCGPRLRSCCNSGLRSEAGTPSSRPAARS